jgi:hypothetical protein
LLGRAIWDLGLRRQHCGQLQLCVPQIITKGDSHRLAEALAGKGVIPLAT